MVLRETVLFSRDKVEDCSKKRSQVFTENVPLIADVFKPVAPPKNEYYKALYEFEPRNPDEMALDEGDIVVVSLCNAMCIMLCN